MSGLTEAQHAERIKGIGGSEAPIILGASPYKSAMELYAEKLGIAPREFEGNGYTRAGQALEPHIISEYTLATGHDVDVSPERCHSLVHPEIEYVRANLDGIDAEDGAIVECKAVFSWQSWENGWGKGETAPLHYQVQVQHYMWVTGRDHARIVGWSPSNRCEVAIVECPRDDEFITGKLAPSVHRFWRCVQDRTPPDWDGSESCSRALAAIYPAAEAGEDIVPMPMAQELAHQYAAAAERESEAKDERRAIKNEILAMMGPAKYGDLGDGRIVMRYGKYNAIKIKDA